MDDSVDTNVLEITIPACSSTQVADLGADVLTDSTIVSILEDGKYCIKPVGAATNGDIFLLTDKTYRLNCLGFGYVSSDGVIHDFGNSCIYDQTLEGFSCINNGNSAILTIRGYNYTIIDSYNIKLCGEDCISIGRFYFERNSYNPSTPIIDHTNSVNIISEDVTIGSNLIENYIYNEDGTLKQVNKYGTNKIDLYAYCNISIGCVPLCTIAENGDLCDSGEFRYVDSLSLYGKCTNIYASGCLSLSTINCGSYINLTDNSLYISHDANNGFQSLNLSDTGLSIDVNSLCVKSPNLNGCISFKEKEPGSFESTINIDSCIISTCSGSLCIHFIDNLCITDSDSNTIFSSEYGSTFVGCNSGGELYAGGFSIYLDFSYDFYIRNVSNDYNPIMSFSYDTLEIDTSLYSDTTKQGTYEATKGISNVGINKTDNTPYIPDLVNRIFKYSGTVTSFSAKPKYTNKMKDNVLYEFEVWHTIPDASGITYTSPKNVEWLYGDPAESGIELTDGITLYYAFRAFKSGTDVRVQGNLYATTTPQVSQE
jgi:hypothetical protein